MSKLEEVSSKQLALIDGFDAKMNHLQVLVLSLLIGTIYSLYLLYICSTIPGVLSALLLFGSQVAIGFPSIRAFYDLGVSNKEKLHFIDPPERNSMGLTHEIDIHLGEISLIFEKLDLHIHKHDDGSLEDERRQTDVQNHTVKEQGVFSYVLPQERGKNHGRTCPSGRFLHPQRYRPEMFSRFLILVLHTLGLF